MRHGMHYAVLLLVVAMFLATAPAGGQASVERPTYTPGDLWVYDLRLLADLPLPENTTAEVTLSGNSTVAIQATETRNIRGSERTVYRATHALQVDAAGSVSLSFFNMTTNATFSALASADETVYLDTEGLEVWERHTEFAVNVSLDLEVSPGVFFTTSLDANGTIDMALNYTTNSWRFPLSVGLTGEEAFNATGTSFFQTTFAGNMTSQSAPIAFNGSTSFEALREETITANGRQFTTVVVKSTPGTMASPVPTNVSTLTYWSSGVGAPVRYVATNETVEQLEFVLTDYRYQAAGFSFLGLPATIAIPILVGIAVVAIILAIVLGRRRRPVMPPPPPPGP